MGIQSQIEKENIEKEFEEIVKLCVRCKNEENKELIRKAFDLANEAHREMRRKSGEPYIMHPINVAKIVGGEIGLGTTSVVCALLHDVVEDTDYTLEDIENMFGVKVSQIIDGLTKISDVFDQNSSLQAENFRKMLLTLSDDVRVILIKLADRLHNMRTLDSMPEKKQLKIASETLFLYAPLAHRLGLYAIKTELEDLSLKYQHPGIYNEILQKVTDNERKRIAYINKFSLPIINKLTNQNINYNITGRSKSIYSIWNKMQKKDIPFEEVYDIFAIRVVFEPSENLPEKNQCWDIYSVVTDIYQPNPDRLRDWVSTPKANGYEALHTTVMGPEGKWVEVQIRSKRMDEIAEKGYAAHWKYKGDNNDENQLDTWLKKIRELLENPDSNAMEFIDEFKMNLFSSEIYVFTPKGLLKRLPKNATALDFAFEIHTKIGNKAIGAKVNYKLVPLSYILKSGDQVEILTSEKQQPQREWIEYTTTAKAKAAIKELFKKERKDEIIIGKQYLDNKLEQLNISQTSMLFKKLLEHFDVPNREELYSQIGRGLIPLDNIKKIVEKRNKNKWIRYWQLQLTKTTGKIIKKSTKEEDTTIENIDNEEKDKIKKITTNENAGLNFTAAKCCNPIPGDDIVGYLNPNEDIIVHKRNCPNAIKLMSSFGERIITANWKAHKILSFITRVKITGIDQIGIVHNITTIISKDLDANIQSLHFESNEGIFKGYIDLYVHNTYDLDNLISTIKKVKGVRTVSRAESTED